MQIKVFETVTAKGLEKDVNSFLEENQGRIKVLEIKYRLTTSTHGVIIIYEWANQNDKAWN